MQNNEITSLGNRLTREAQILFLNSGFVPGVQTINSEYSQPAVPLKYIGQDRILTVPNGPQQGNVAVSLLVINEDPFLQYTGFSGFNLHILENKSLTGKNWSATSGYLTSYSSRASVGEIPQVSVNIDVFGNIGRLPLSESSILSGQLARIPGASTDFDLTITDPGTITLTMGDFTTNRVLDYNLTLNIPRNAFYPLNSRRPNNVKINWPIEVLTDFTYVVNDYTPQDMRDYPCEATTERITITLKDYQKDQTIVSYDFNDMFLVSEGYSTTIDNNVLINARYLGYMGHPSGF